MDAPPASENPLQFQRTTRYLEELGARVPRLDAVDSDRGLLILEDLGDLTFTRLLNSGGTETSLYQNAVDELIGIQNRFADNAHRITLPDYDFDAALAELNLFADWYLPARIGRKLTASERADFEQIWLGLFAARPPMPRIMVHRDYHVDNLLMVAGRCAMLDYQDALLGSPLYDLVSLLEDARRDVSPALQDALITRWRSAQTITTNPGDKDFNAEYRFWGAQRHCKVAGIFVRLWLRDNKSNYLQHLPRVMSLLDKNLCDPAMQPLHQWIMQFLPGISHAPIQRQREFLIEALELQAQ